MKNATVDAKAGKTLPFQPKKLISLWDVISQYALAVLHRFDYLNVWRLEARAQVLENGPGSVISQEDALEFIANVALTKEFFEKCPISYSRLENFMDMLRRGNVPHVVVESEMDGLMVSMRNELEVRTCAFIPESKSQFFESENLFGHDVWIAFPEAKQEIKDAGNCLAADLNTAAVFHLMRIAELGLRKLAKALKIKLSHQIEFATWGSVIGAIDIELTKTKSLPRSTQRDERLKYQSSLLLDIKAFQHLWRDPVSHMRGTFTDKIALDAFDHIKDFMQKLSEGAFDKFLTRVIRKK